MGTIIVRLKANGRAFRYSPLSRVIELEALFSGVMAKLRLWQALVARVRVDTRLDEPSLSQYATAATNQLETIRRLHAMAADEAFT